MLRQGITYAHEHVTVDLSGVKGDIDCRLDCQGETIAEFRRLKALGVANVIDVTNRGMGRNVEYVQQVAARTGIHVVSATGYYKEPFLPEEVYALDEKALADIMIAEILEGIDGTGIRAGIIGEIGASQDRITPAEAKVFAAAARAHRETGRPISTHTTLGRLGLEQVDLLQRQGVDLAKVIIGHADLSGDAAYVLRLLDRGVFVAFDTIGKINYMAEERRLATLRAVCDRGLAGRVVLSMDITRRSHLASFGGIGYSYLLQSFIPFIRANGIAEADIQDMLCNNIHKIFQ
ncbi:MAG TPA: hypothetical protein PKA10_17580 [Selenomonadales bacterium]|nr:hypothetical protein [Selenomonadales bacterium]